MDEKKTSAAKLSYEAARDELAEIVESLEDGSASLEESLKLWERGEELAKICQEWLDGAKEKLAAVKKEAK
jgi:exodeoxyribonuclease VII small subunit